MISDDFDRFSKLMGQLASVYGKRLDDGQVQWYWDALKDRDIADIERRANEYSRKGKFFPKPVNLRPFEGDADDQSRKSLSEDAAYQAALKHNEKGWAEAIASDPLMGRINASLALLARYDVASDHGSPAWQSRREWLLGTMRELYMEWLERGRPENMAIIGMRMLFDPASAGRAA